MLNCCDCTQLTTLPSLPNLEELWCTRCTQLTTLPSFPRLKNFRCRECPWINNPKNLEFSSNLKKLIILQRWWRNIRRYFIFKEWIKTEEFAKWFYHPDHFGGFYHKNMLYRQLSHPCKYSFKDLIMASKSSQSLSELYHLPQEERNQRVKILCKEANWYYKDIVGVDGITYTSFSPYLK